MEIILTVITVDKFPSLPEKLPLAGSSTTVVKSAWPASIMYRAFEKSSGLGRMLLSSLSASPE